VEEGPEKELEAMFEDQLILFVNDKVSQAHRDTVISKMTGNTPEHRRVRSDASRSAAKQQGEKEFFKLIVLSVLLSSPPFMIE
jgi:hypothetical protein